MINLPLPDYSAGEVEELFSKTRDCVVQYLHIVGMIDYSAREVEELFSKTFDCAISKVGMISCLITALERWKNCAIYTLLA